jgi:predicted deacetylase
MAMRTFPRFISVLEVIWMPVDRGFEIVFHGFEGLDRRWERFRANVQLCGEAAYAE